MCVRSVVAGQLMFFDVGLSQVQESPVDLRGRAAAPPGPGRGVPPGDGGHARRRGGSLAALAAEEPGGGAQQGGDAPAFQEQAQQHTDSQKPAAGPAQVNS